MGFWQRYIIGQALLVIRAIVEDRTIEIDPKSRSILREVRDGINLLIGK